MIVEIYPLAYKVGSYQQPVHSVFTETRREPSFSTRVASFHRSSRQRDGLERAHCGFLTFRESPIAA